MYRQVLDLFATSIDYDAKSNESLNFFKIVQNKLHYAAHGHTAAEVIYYRVDSDKPFLGLTNFAGSKPTKAEAMIAKNYLEEKELKILNNIVSGYFDFAEIQAIKQIPMTMKSHGEYLDKILTMSSENLLQNAGEVSHQQAIEKAEKEYKKYQVETLSEVEKSYLDSLKHLESVAKKNTKFPKK